MIASSGRAYGQQFKQRSNYFEISLTRTKVRAFSPDTLEIGTPPLLLMEIAQTESRSKCHMHIIGCPRCQPLPKAAGLSRAIPTFSAKTSFSRSFPSTRSRALPLMCNFLGSLSGVSRRRSIHSQHLPNELCASTHSREAERSPDAV